MAKPSLESLSANEIAARVVSEHTGQTVPEGVRPMEPESGTMIRVTYTPKPGGIGWIRTVEDFLEPAPRVPDSDSYGEC